MIDLESVERDGFFGRKEENRIKLVLELGFKWKGNYSTIQGSNFEKLELSFG